MRKLFLICAFIVACSGGSDDTDPNNPARPPQANNISGPRPEVGPRDYVLFESGQVRPLAILKEGMGLVATNTPNGTLQWFETREGSLNPRFSISVGIDPVAVAQAPNGKVWVVNHVSDNISIVDLELNPPRVIRTLWVGDEPQDIVFAGPDKRFAFITTAHRGQNSPVDPGLETPGIGRADVWIFDSQDLGVNPGGTPHEIITLMGDKPRGLATNAEGDRVYAGIFLSGNQTTVIGPSNLPKSGPNTSADGIAAPDSGLILKFRDGQWQDETGRNYSSSVPFQLPDYDVFEIAAESENFSENKRWSGVGTILFNVAVDAQDRVWVSNLDSRNHIRFAGLPTANGTSVRGHLADHRLTLLENDEVSPIDLNPHLDYALDMGTESDRETSISNPTSITFSEDEVWVAGYGSQKLFVYELDPLLQGQAQLIDSIELMGGGPMGLVWDDFGNLITLTRFDNGISIIDPQTKAEVFHTTMTNPEPQHIVEGRKFLYDARLTSSRGNDSCATCHIFGNNDGLAWDLGNPNDETQAVTNTFITISDPVAPYRFHPLKGPMTTQSMRGTKGHGPMHWRGDRTGEDRKADETLEEAAFKEFNEAFDGLMALGREISDEDMQVFTDFAMELTYPPNPIRGLDQGLNEVQQRGFNLFRNGVVRQNTGQLEVCIQCHPIEPQAGIFGTRGLMSDNIQAGERNMKIPHFRDQYQKVGMFGWAFNAPPVRGPQVKGFGWNHSGTTSGNFVIADLGIPAADVSALRQFLFTFPTESAPIVGQQLTIGPNPNSDAVERLDMFIQRAEIEQPIPECDLIAHLTTSVSTWWLYQNGQWQNQDQNLTTDQLLQLLTEPTDRITFSATPWGTGPRLTQR